VRYLLGGVFIVQMGAFVQAFIVLYLVERGFGVGQAAVALTAYSVGATIGTLIGGELTHRVGPRVTITVTMAVSAVIVGLVPLLSQPSLFSALVVLVAVAGLSTQCYRPGAAVLLSQAMPEEHRVMAFSMMRIALNSGATLGPLIAAGLILINWDLLFYFNSAAALAYAAVAHFLLPHTTAPREADAAAADRRSAYALLVRDHRFLLYLASGLLSAAVYVQAMAALPLKITTDGHPTAVYSLVLAQASLLLILLELKITSYVRHGPPHVVVAAGTAVLGLGVAGYALVGASVPLLLVSTFVFVLGVMVSGPTAFAHPAKFPLHVRARYIGAQQATFGLGLAIGPTAGIFAWQALADRAFLLFGLAGLVAAVCALVGMKERRATPSAATSVSAP
jgi:MFS family permease